MDKEFILGVIFAIVGYVLKELWVMFKSKMNKENLHNEDVLKENTNAIYALKESILKLGIRLDNLDSKLESLPKMQSDINEAHTRIREIKTFLEVSHEH